MHKLRFSHLFSFAILMAAYTFQKGSAQSPPGFQPPVSNHLTVSYGSDAISPAGITVPVDEVASAPSLGLDDARATFVTIMLDFSIETAGSNTTLLHWVLPGLSSNGATNLSSQRAEIAPYFPPGPPAGQTHTYGIFLYNEPTNFAVPENFVPFFKNLTAPGASVLTRVGFNLTNFVVETGLGAPVAADWFLVRNATMSSTTTTTATSSRAVSATNTGASTGSTSSTSSNPLTTQSASDAMTIRIKSIVVAFGALCFVVNLL